MAVEAGRASESGEQGATELGGGEADLDPAQDLGADDLDIDPWECLDRMVGVETKTAEKPSERLREKARSLRQRIGWIEAELRRLEGRRKKPTRKQTTLTKRLSKLFGKGLTIRKLRMCREKQKALLRVKREQMKVAMDKEKKRVAERKVASGGPKVLGGEGTNRQPVSETQANDIGRFWKGVWGTKGHYQPNHPAIELWKREVGAKVIDAGEGEQILEKVDAWTSAVKKQPSWKAPGPDMIPGYWYKAFKRPARCLMKLLWERVEDGEIPGWLIEGRTVMIPKDGCEGKPEQYRPITCLNTAYKLLTGALTVILMQHVESTGILPEEQKALRKGARGCLDALLIDGAVAKEAKMWRRNLSVAWIDYAKAYDMTPHRWIKDMLKAIRAPKVVNCGLRKIMPKWRTCIELPGEEGSYKIPVRFRRGLYQGDSLSPLLFCLCVAPLSQALNEGGGFQSLFQKEPVTHMMFMDDLKIFEQSKEELEATVHVAEDVSGAVGMKLGAKKCAIAHMRAGRVRGLGGTTTPRTAVAELARGESYKYLGVRQVILKERKKTVEAAVGEYKKRVRKVWNSPLNARSKAAAHNSWAVGVLRYFCGVVDWSEAELIDADRQTRKVLKKCKAHHKGAAVERLYLPRDRGGRGLLSVMHLWEREKVATAMYTRGSQDPQVQGAVRLEDELGHMGEETLMTRARDVLERYQVNGQSYW